MENQILQPMQQTHLTTKRQSTSLQRICHALLSVALLLLPACTQINLGGAVDQIGKKEATPHYQAKELRGTTMYTPAPTPAWKKDGKYYVQLPISYVPTREAWITHLSHYIDLVFDFPKPYNRKEISQYPTEIYYAVLDEKQFQAARKHPKTEFKSRMDRMKYSIVPESEIDLSGATLVTKNTSYFPGRILGERLSDRRTFGNQCRRPLVLILDIADIPLTLAATPIGWFVDLIVAPF